MSSILTNDTLTKYKMDELVQLYETPKFIKDDPIQFPHRYKKKEDIEIAAFISSLVSYGSRKQFNEKLKFLFSEVMNESPFEYIANFQPETVGNFNYRFGKPVDFISIFESLKYLYKNSCSLGILFQDGYRKGRMLENVVHFFYHQAKEDVGAGFYQMLPNPDSKGAMKRMWMFMRWMVRDGAVDLGLWNFYPKSELLIPLDVHVARISRQYELLNRKSNDFKAVVELTNNLKVFDSQDPVKYDFALFGLGVNSEK